jgi:hypothetical protein
LATKHDKYAFIDVGNGLYTKVRVMKGRKEGAERYVLTGLLVKRIPRGAPTLSKESLPQEIKNLL